MALLLRCGIGSALGITVAAMVGCQTDVQVQTPAVSAPEPAASPAYVSRVTVTRDCGPVAWAAPPPGFQEAPNVPMRPMPEIMTKAQTVGAEREFVATDADRVSDGFVLIEPGAVKQSFLIDNDKEIVAAFEGSTYGMFSQFQPDGNIVISGITFNEGFANAGGANGCIEEITPQGELAWRISVSTEDHVLHHDYQKLDNGNVLALVWERVTTAEVIHLGREPELVADNGDFWYEKIVEIDPLTLEVVWEWSIRDHLIQDFDPAKANYGVVAEHPERLDINVVRRSPDGSVSPDWTHVNAIDYSEELDQIALSSNFLSEIWIIDHSTTPYEAAAHTGGRHGKGGDFLYRWGNPANYGRGAAEDRVLFNQHDVQWIRDGLPGAGNLLIFNNGDLRARFHSTVVELQPLVDANGSYVLDGEQAFGPDSLIWEYDPEPPERFFSWFVSGAQRLANGNTLINLGARAGVREVTATGEIVWEYQYPDPDAEGPHMMFRANRYAADHPTVLGLLGRQP